MSTESTDSDSAPAGPLPSPSAPSWARIEMLVAGAISLWIVCLHGLFLFHAGPLWRDEVGTIDFASMPTVADIWRNMQYDNFPPLFVAVARVWTLAGLSSDFDYRILGFLIGLGTLGVIWFSARSCGARVPLLALALYGANPLAIRVGDSMRPYGIGIALTMLTLALTWKFVENPRPRTLLWATLAAVLAVQSLYHNAIFIMAFSLAAWSVTLARRQWKTAAQTLVIGVVAALSLLPHLSNIRKGQDWVGINKWPVHLHDLWQPLLGALNPEGGRAEWIWGGLALLALVVAVRHIARTSAWNMLYCATALVAAVVLYLPFLQLLGLPPQSWYFLILLAPVALALDAIVAGVGFSVVGPARAALALLLALLNAQVAGGMAQIRQTNMDWIAATLKQNARPQDVILVVPWYYAVSLQHYYGTNSLTTLPPMDEFRIHRYDLMKRQMEADDPLGPLLKDIERAFRSGHALWVVGEYRNPPDNTLPPSFPPYRGQVTTPMPKYGAMWLYQVGHLVKTHSVEGGRWPVAMPDGVAVSPLENVPLAYFHGWKE